MLDDAYQPLSLPYSSADGSTTIEGRDWMHERRTWRDVILCRLGAHRAVMRAWTNYVDYSTRCSCGAIGERHRVGLPGQASRSSPELG